MYHLDNHQISKACKGEICRICKAEATHKVGEEILFDDPNKIRHNLTAYVCCDHFKMIFIESDLSKEEEITIKLSEDKRDEELWEWMKQIYKKTLFKLKKESEKGDKEFSKDFLGNLLYFLSEDDIFKIRYKNGRPDSNVTDRHMVKIINTLISYLLSNLKDKKLIQQSILGILKTITKESHLKGLSVTIEEDNGENE
jgi:hypothetical protein